MSILQPHPDLPVAFASEYNTIDDQELTALTARIASAYRDSASKFEGHGASMWANFDRIEPTFHPLLMNDEIEALKTRLRYPHTTELLSFEEIEATKYAVNKARNKKSQQAYGKSVHATLIKLAQAVGAIRVPSPEAWTYANFTFDLKLESLIAALDEKFGFRIDFPNPYANEFGLRTSRGVISIRALNAIYQAWRIASFGEVGAIRVLEIGAGLGRTAYYSRRFGVRDYTIVDIPLSNVAQSDFLGKLLGPSEIVLANEREDILKKGKTRILSPDWFFSSTEQFDVALNVDSITEIDCGQATDYFREIVKRSNVFISINHEHNPFRASDLPALAGVSAPAFRHPYWMRDGFVEEIFHFTRNALPGPNANAELERSAKTILNQQVQLVRQADILNSRRALVRLLIELTLQKSRVLRSRP